MLKNILINATLTLDLINPYTLNRQTAKLGDRHDYF
jgi:hypothetical protein